MRVQKQDLARFEKKLASAQKTDVIEGTVNRVGEHLLGQSVPLAPVDRGDLRGFGNSDPYAGTNGPGVAVGFDEPYAFHVHENLDPNVQWSEPGTGPKYLEQPYLENKAAYSKAIKQAAVKQARGGR